MSKDMDTISIYAQVRINNMEGEDTRLVTTRAQWASHEPDIVRVIATSVAEQIRDLLAGDGGEYE